jgi:hypothetical protein
MRTVVEIGLSPTRRARSLSKITVIEAPKQETDIGD